MKIKKLIAIIGIVALSLFYTVYGQSGVFGVHSSFGNDPKTEMFITWFTPVSDTSSYVLYGETTSYGLQSRYELERVILQDVNGTTFMVHHVTLSGLNPGTKYHYKCGGDAGLSNDCTFKTAPAGNQVFTFAVIADIQESVYPAAFNTFANYAKDMDLSFVIQLGDMVKNGCYLSEWIALFQAGTPIFENAPFMANTGTNHDVGYQGIVEYFCQDIFKFPSNNSVQHKSIWHSFEYSNSIFTGVAFSRPETLDEQKLWLDSLFSNTSKPWKFSYWHTNPYSTGNHGGDDLDALLPYFLDITDTYNVATVFNGHSHAYEFTHPISEVGNPPVVSEAFVDWDNRKATANHSQGTVFYNGASVCDHYGSYVMNSYNINGLPQEFTLTGDYDGGDWTALFATVYNDSIVYKVIYYSDCCPSMLPGIDTYKQGDTLFTYTIINDDPGTQYALTVNNGSGDGNYTAGTAVVIIADAPVGGKVFDEWTGDVAGVVDVNSASTTITMPADNAIVTATYKDAPPSYILTVINGTGGGSYTSGTIVNITANAPAVGRVFNAWTGDVAGIANVNASSTTIIMPASIANITATYEDAPPDTYTLTVINGTGSGNYTASTLINISANAPATGKVFDAWTGDVTGIANVNASSTTITMPASAANITATYKDVPPDTYTLTVVNGTGSGNYTASTLVNISANTPETGKVFDVWTGNVAGIANINDASTSITMPAGNATITASYSDIENALGDKRKNGITIYPNPVSDILNIEGNDISESTIHIIDMAGKVLLVINSNETEKLEIPVGDLSNGIYIIEVLRDNDIDYFKFSKQ